MKTLQSLTLIFTLTSIANAQSYSGLETSEYMGIKSLVFNPANVANSRFIADFNILSGSAAFTNDYVSLHLNELLSNSESFDFVSDTTRAARNDNRMNMDIDLLGPGILVNKSRGFGFAITTRVRGGMSGHNLNGNFIDSMLDDSADQTVFEFDLDNLNTTTHAWGEVGITLGGILWEQGSHSVTGGATVKALAGAGVVYANSNRLSGTFNDDSGDIDAEGFLTFGSTLNNADEFNFDSLTPGFGIDIGLAYAFQPDGLDTYRFKLGVAVTDFGRIKYDNVEQTIFDVSGNVDNLDFDNLETFLQDNFDGVTTTESVTVNLPTAARVYGDINLTGGFYLGASALVSLREANRRFGTRLASAYRIIPRYENRWFSLLSPVSFDENSALNWGLGLRLGPVVAGSSNVFSSLAGGDTKAADFFVGVNVPILR